MSMISLLLHESEVKLRISVNNKDIIRMYLGYAIVISWYECDIIVITLTNVNNYDIT